MLQSTFLMTLLCVCLSRTLALLAPDHQPASSHALFHRTSSALTSSVVVDAPTKSLPSIPSTRPTREQQKSRSHNYEQHLWEVKVYNDNINTHEWVARCLVMVVAQTEWQAYQTTKLAHQQGEACLGIWEQELAQRYVDGLSQQGLIVDMFPLGDLQ